MDVNLERQISELALNRVKARRGPKEGEYRAFCEGFPVLLRTAGLAQTLAFLRAKGGPPQGDVYDDLCAHFEKLQLSAAGALYETMIGAQTLTPQYRFCSQVALRVAFWHKRLAQALLRKSE